MSKTLRKILTVLLVIAMLFGISATTVAATLEGTGEGSDLDAGGSSTDSIIDSIDKGWISIEYTDDEIIVTLTPDLEAAKLVDEEMIKELATLLIEAVKKVIVEDLLEFGGTADTSTFVDTDGLDVRNVWMSAFGGYVTEKFPVEGGTEKDSYVEFIKSIIDKDDAVNELADYVASVVRAAVIAGAIEKEDLPSAEDVEDLMSTELEGYIDSFIRDEVEATIDEYIDHVHTNAGQEFKPEMHTAMDRLVERYIGEFVVAEVKTHVEHVRAGTTPGSVNDMVWSAVNAFVSDLIGEITDEYVAYLIDSSANSFDTTDKARAMFKEFFDASIKGAVDAYLSGDTTGLGTLGVQIVTHIENYITSVVESSVDIYIAIERGTKTLAELDEVETAVYNKIAPMVDSYLDGVMVDYLAIVKGDTSKTIEPLVKAEIDKYVTKAFIDNYDTNFATYFANYKNYKTGVTATEPELYSYIESIVKENAITKIADKVIELDPAYDRTAAEAEAETKYASLNAAEWAYIFSDKTGAAPFDTTDPAQKWKEALTTYTVSSAPADYRDQFIGTGAGGEETVKVDIPVSVYESKLGNATDRAQYIEDIIDYAVNDATAEKIVKDYIDSIDLDTIIDDGLKSTILSTSDPAALDALVREMVKYLNETESATPGVTLLDAILDSVDMSSVLEDYIKSLKVEEGVVDEVADFLSYIESYLDEEKELHDLIVEVVADLETQPGAEAGTTELDDLTEILLDEVIEEAHSADNTDPDSALNSVLKDIFGIDTTIGDLLYRIDGAGNDNSIASLIAKRYAAMLDELDKLPEGPQSYLELLKHISAFTVNGKSIYTTVDGKGAVFSLDALKELAKEIPTFSEIAEMDDDEMQLSYLIGVETDLLVSTEFRVTVKLGGGYDKVRKLASIIDRNLQVSLNSNGNVTINVTVPDELAKAALKACNSSRVPDRIKTKVFAAMSASPNDAMALINYVTFDELRELLDYVDFDKILDHEFVSRFESLDGLTAEQIKNKVAEYEGYYNKAIKIINRAYTYVPASVKEKTLIDFYDGNGTFSAKGSATVDLVEIAYKLGEKYADRVDALLDKTTFHVSVDATVTFRDVYKVTYYTGTNLVREGFLPVGADLTFFSGVSQYLGETIIAWADASGNRYEKMPAADVELYAITTAVTATLTATETSKVYDGEAITLTVAVTSPAIGGTYTYEWYNGTTLVATTTEPTLAIKNVADSGSYYVKASVTSADFTGNSVSNAIDITITAKEIDLSGVKWIYTVPYTYTGNAQGVTIDASTVPDKVTLVGETDNSKTDAGNYTAVATFAIGDTNYTFKDGNTVSLDWVIKAIEYDNDDISFVIGDYTYAPNTTHKVTVNAPAGLVVTVVDNSDTATDAGTYTTVVSVAAENTNYVWAGTATVASTAWVVKQATVTVAAAFNYSAPYSYEPGKTYTVGYDYTVTGGDKAVVEFTEGGVKSASSVGTYVYTLTAKIADAYTKNYKLDGTASFECTWKIIDVTYDLGTLTWKVPAGVSYVYDGTPKAHPYIEVPAQYASLTKINYTVTPAGSPLDPINAGTYVITATVESLDPSIVFGYQLSSPTFEWTIEKASKDAASLGITFEDKSFTYDGTAHSIAITGTLPAGATVTYTGNDQTAVGQYTVTATVNFGDANYNDLVLTAKITITPVGTIGDFAHGDEIKINVAEGLAEGHELVASDATAATQSVDFSSLCDANKIATLIKAYDIKFEFNDTHTNVSGTFTVKILIPAAYRAPETRNIIVVYVAPDGALTAMTTTRNGDYAVFETDHFSTYALVEISDKPVTPPACTDHVDTNNDGKCDNCGADMPTPPPCTDHVDNNNDGKCDNCGADMPTPPPCTDHVDENGDGKCDKCGEDMPTPPPCTDHVDEDGDGKCDKCGEDMPEDKDLTWLWIVLGILLLIIIIIIIVLIITRKSDEDDEPTEPETEPTEPEAEAVIEPEVEETVEEAPVEEAPVEEAPVEEAPVEEAPVEEAPAEEAPVEEAPAPAPAPAPVYAATDDEDEGLGKRLVNGVIVPVRYRTSFTSRLIQAEPDIQDYYTVVKNALLSYKGVKARTSWNFESFNKGRIQCAKLNVKGSAFQVYLGLDPNEYNVNKYHFVDVSDKPKLDKVPMLLKVKSDRALKYALELIEEVMRVNEIEQGELPNVDYHMPYETTEALVDRELVKVILPAGMVIDENTVIERVNVGELLKDAKEAAGEEDTPVEAAVAPVEEPKVQIVDHRVAEEQIVHVDAVEADDYITDTQAKELVEAVEHAPGFKPKSAKHYEINLDTICENFEDGDTVTLAALKSKNLITKKADRIKVLARGTMTKKLTVVADKFSIQAIKMIGLAGGLAQKYKD